MRHAGDRAPGVTEDAIALLESRRRRRPAARETAIEEIARRRLMIPHGDRRDRAHSRRVEHKDEPLAPRHDHIVGVFVLSDDLANGPRRLLCAQPLEDRTQRAEIAQRETKTHQLAVRDLAGGVDGDLTKYHA